MPPVTTLLEDLHNESDVEQKLLYPMLTLPEPEGCGYTAADILTKENLRQLTIDKGQASKVYRPDYAIVLSGLPIAVIEAKHPGDDDLEEALREARLYAAELNARHSHAVNPCIRVAACNGRRLLSSPSDSATPDIDLSYSELNQASEGFATLLGVLARSTLQEEASRIRSQTGISGRKWRPLQLLGGQTIRNEEIGYNEFGAKLATEFLHLFNPRTREERVHIVRNAYITSRRREHYVDEIDRVLRASLPRSIPEGTDITDTSNPRQLVEALRQGVQLQDKLFLLVGSVGSGKSTFVTYFRETKLPAELEGSTLWIHVDVNDAPPSKGGMEQWIAREIVRKLKASVNPDTDVDSFAFLEKVFSVELNRLNKGPLAQLDPNSDKYKESVSDELRKLLSDEQHHARALARYLVGVGGRNRLLVLVVDNCDKGDRVEQLDVFQTIRWVQSWLRCLVFLPIRDVTYGTCKNMPPLDTAIKDFVFHIEPPPFTKVLRRRLQLALDELSARSTGKKLVYHLESGIAVHYPETEVGLYLACIFKSVYENDHLLRQMIVGLAGRDIRKAMEIFLDFCRSGHIDEQEYLKIRTQGGNYSLPPRVINRVLLRQNRRYYDGNMSYIKNLFQCDPDEAAPDHLARLAILRWLDERFRQTGPAGIRGFHRSDKLLSELVPLGHDAGRLRREANYLLDAGCIIAEHQRTDSVADTDLICLSSAGFVHLRLLRNHDYLAACAEDTWFADQGVAEAVAERIGGRGPKYHFSHRAAMANATGFLGYLAARIQEEVARPDEYLSAVGVDVSAEVLEMEKGLAAKSQNDSGAVAWANVAGKYEINKAYEGRVVGSQTYGVFVELEQGVKGLIHVSTLPAGTSPNTFVVDRKVRVTILEIDGGGRKLSLAFVE